jgi:hypothetical protein
MKKKKRKKRERQKTKEERQKEEQRKNGVSGPLRVNLSPLGFSFGIQKKVLRH